MLTATVRIVDVRPMGWAVLGPGETVRDDAGKYVPFDEALVRPFRRPFPGSHPMGMLAVAEIPEARHAMPIGLFDLSTGKPVLVDIAPVWDDQSSGVRGTVTVNVTQGH